MKGNSHSFFSFQYTFRLLRTLRYLKFEQIFFRLYYPIKRYVYNQIPVRISYKHPSFVDKTYLFGSYIQQQSIFNIEEQSITFLNKTYHYKDKINWRFSEYGKLWTFNLHYFEWLNDAKIDVEFCLDTIIQWIENDSKDEIFINSYTASIRIPNWIKFICKNNIDNKDIVDSLYLQSLRLYHFPEYDIQGNHLLENGIALQWAASFFKNQKFQKKANEILSKELKCQFLSDAIHFEKSLAYQSNILKNTLDLIVFLEVQDKENKLINLLKYNASQSLSIVKLMSCEATKYPHFGDSNERIAVSYSELKFVAQSLGINMLSMKLGESGFRKFHSTDLELFFNCGNICANYQPGHAHADAFSFCLNVKNIPTIVDRGMSTYEVGTQRLMERGTEAHNTLCVEGEDSAELWSSFRMGRRPNILLLKDEEEYLNVEHDAYFKKYKIQHNRSLKFSEKSISIEDKILGWNGQKCKLFLHLHPNIYICRENDDWIVKNNNFLIHFEGCEVILESYQYCLGFNETIEAQRFVLIVQKPTVKTLLKLINE